MTENWLRRNAVKNASQQILEPRDYTSCLAVSKAWKATLFINAKNNKFLNLQKELETSWESKRCSKYMYIIFDKFLIKQYFHCFKVRPLVHILFQTDIFRQAISVRIVSIWPISECVHDTEQGHWCLPLVMRTESENCMWSTTFCWLGSSALYHKWKQYTSSTTYGWTTVVSFTVGVRYIHLRSVVTKWSE
jgi:hypothetical protein